MAKKKKPKTLEQKRKEEREQEAREDEKLILILQDHKAEQEIEVYLWNEIHYEENQQKQLKKINRHLRRVGKTEFTIETIKEVKFDPFGKVIDNHGKPYRELKIVTEQKKFLKKLAKEEPVVTADMEGVAPAPKAKEEEEVIE